MPTHVARRLGLLRVSHCTLNSHHVPCIDQYNVCHRDMCHFWVEAERDSAHLSTLSFYSTSVWHGVASDQFISLSARGKVT